MRHYTFTSPIVTDRPPNDDECDNTGYTWYSTNYCNGSTYMTFGRPKVVRYHWQEGMFWTKDRPSVCLGDYNQTGYYWKERKYDKESLQTVCLLCNNLVLVHANLM